LTTERSRGWAIGLPLALLFIVLVVGLGCATPVAEPEVNKSARIESASIPGLVYQGLSAADAELGTKFLPLTRQLGFTRLVFAARTGTGNLYEYLPEGETLEDWQHLATIHLSNTGRPADEWNSVLAPYAAKWPALADAVREKQTFSGPAGDVYFVNYETGWGELKEYNLAVIWQFQPSVIATFQSKQRRTPVVERQVDRFKLLAKRLTRKVEARDENQFRYGEVLLTPGTPFMDPDEWEVFEKKEAKSRSLMWRRKGEGPTDAYQVDVSRGDSLPPDKFRKAIDDGGRKTCDRFNSIDLERTKSEGLESEFWRTECAYDGRLGVQSVQIIILGQDAFYRVQKWWDGPVTAEERDEWVANLSSVYVCDTRSVGRDCPEGWHKAKAASSANE